MARPEQEVLAALVGLLHRLPAAGTSLDALLELSAAEIEKLFPALAGCVAFAEDGPGGLVLSALGPHGCGTLGPGHRLLGPDDPRLHRLRQGDPVLLLPAPPLANGPPEIAVPGFASILAVPLRADGRLFAAWILAARRPDAFGAAEIHLLSLLGDALSIAVSRTRLAQQTRDRAAQLAEAEKLAIIGRLVAGVAHELGGPLQAIITLAELLGRDPERGDRVEAAHRILRSALRCRGMVQDLLSFARKQPARAAPVQIAETLMDALELDRFSDVGEVQVQIDEAPKLPRVLADSQRLAQVFLNLITNARQATASAGHPGLVRVTLEVLPAPQARLAVPPGTAVIRIAIMDRGPGVPPELRPRIFEPFVTTKPDGQGTGLGLSISRTLVEDAGGCLYLDETYAPGARFVVELPALTADAASASDAARDEADAAAGCRGCSILIIDDDREVLETYEAILALDDHRVRSCDRARKALDILAEESFDVVLCDVRLPDLLGREFLTRLQAVRPDMAARVIFATGDVVNDDTRAFLASIPNPALIKPFQVDDLTRAIARVTRPRV